MDIQFTTQILSSALISCCTIHMADSCVQNGVSELNRAYWVPGITSEEVCRKATRAIMTARFRVLCHCSFPNHHDALFACPESSGRTPFNVS
ncbi:unnamed protein product [Sphagnum jensenii]|uniref:Secreted protein n=1 Tax=Sphagnum jensenii TaxID=128206 RepID=A0ABP0VQK9_9BRYO